MENCTGMEWRQLLNKRGEASRRPSCTDPSPHHRPTVVHLHQDLISQLLPLCLCKNAVGNNFFSYKKIRYSQTNLERPRWLILQLPQLARSRHIYFRWPRGRRGVSEEPFGSSFCRCSRICRVFDIQTWFQRAIRQKRQRPTPDDTAWVDEPLMLLCQL